MSEEKAENNQDELKGGTRRSRKDQEGRDYICGCGKRYLSYPALYTHIKTKHEGHQPEGTQKTGVNNIARRQKQKLDDRLLKEVYDYMDSNNLRILKELGQCSGGSVQFTHRIKRQKLSRQIYQAYQQLNKFSTLSLRKDSSLELVLVVYLLNVGNYVGEELYTYYLNFAKYFTSCFHQYGLEIFEQCFKGEGDTKIQTFSREQCKYVPLISDFFIRFYVPSERKDDNFQSLMELLTYDFCHWLFDRKLTNIQVILNKEYKILNKDFIKQKVQEKKNQKIEARADREQSGGESHELSEQISLNHAENGKIQEIEEREILSLKSSSKEEVEKKVIQIEEEGANENQD